MESHTTTKPSKLMKLPSVLERVPFSKTEFYRRIKQGTAPKAIRLGVKAVAWLESDIDQYIQNLAKESAK